MARYTCPSCGAVYNGKRCRECLYEHFTEEIAHGNHTHEGEPLVIDAPVRKAIPQKDPFGCEKKERKQAKKRTSKRSGPAILIAVLCLLSPLVELVFDFIGDVTVGFEEVAPEPESIPLPEDGITLYDDGEILVVADWQDGEPLEDGFSVVLQNDGDRDVGLRAEDIVVNDYLMEYSYLYCQANSGYMGKGYFRVDETDLVNAQLSAIQDVSFYLEIYDAESYETIAVTESFTFHGSFPEDAPRHTEFVGIPLMEQDGIVVKYLGYTADEYYPDEFTEGTLHFYLENNTERYLQFYFPEAYWEEESVDISLWCELPPGTRGVTTVYLYGLEDSGLTEKDLGELSFQLEIDDRNDYDFSIVSDLLRVSGEA